MSCGSVSRLGVKPICFCGQNAVFRIARTPKNKGKRFWGCPKFKRVGVKIAFMECVFFLDRVGVKIVLLDATSFSGAVKM
ncbi:hypothetical protein LR48_Vigan03g117800 [Vigna angularis]|uniref:GRF-type domain-containing protein n=1 Tax=Phaseolus angularis TaxID=3914 RepID=A0A0L9U4T9_PHAAN|nr:hypothetical protein LR48_Vigan03g117800 [Vigna angularis]